MGDLQMAHEAGLLSLPDKVLGKIALMTCDRRPGSEPFKDWARAAVTCKRLWALQLDFDRTSRTHEGQWHLKRTSCAELICTYVDEWPYKATEKKELADSLTKVLGNLQQLERLDFGPTMHSLRPLAPWIEAMLSGACNLKHLSVGAGMLKFLPSSTRQALESLHIDARNAGAVQHACTAVKDCQQLRSLTIVSHYGSAPAPGGKELPDIPELDLRHLEHLRTCRLDCVPAPGNMYLPEGLGELELTTTPEQVAMWSKLWHTVYKIKYHVHCIKIGGPRRFAHHAQPADVLATWPKEIRDFHFLQFLQVTCEGAGLHMWRPPNKILDLAHVAHIPHVSIQSTGDMFVKIPEGSWKVLELKSARVMHVDVQDPMGFVMCTELFSFTFPADARPSYNIEKLEKALKEAQRNTGAEIPRKLYEYHDSPGLICKKHRDEPSLVELTNCQREGIAGESAYENALLGARIKAATSAGYPEINCVGLGRMCIDSFFQKLPSPVEPTNRQRQSIPDAFTPENAFSGACIRSPTPASWDQWESILGETTNGNLGARVRSATGEGYPETRFTGIAENLRRIQKECAS